MKVDILLEQNEAKRGFGYWQLTVNGERLACGLGPTDLPDDDMLKSQLLYQLKRLSGGQRLDDTEGRWPGLEDQPTKTIVLDLPAEMIEKLRTWRDRHGGLK